MTRSIPNYICVTCARGFTTAASGRRHVANVESGNGYITTEAEYRTQLLLGKIPPPVPKLHRQFRQQPAKKRDKTAVELADEAFRIGYYRRLGELKCTEQFKKSEQTKRMADVMYNIMTREEQEELKNMLSSDAAGGSTNKKLEAFAKRFAESKKKSDTGQTGKNA